MKSLIIDDELPVLTKMKAMLSVYGECVLATSAEQGLRQVAAALQTGAPFDLITIDIHLPEVNGLDLLARITALEAPLKGPSSKKLMVSAAGTKDNLFKAFRKGCDGFLVKPVKRDVLDAKMAELGYSKQPVQPD